MFNEPPNGHPDEIQLINLPRIDLTNEQASAKNSSLMFALRVWRVVGSAELFAFVFGAASFFYHIASASIDDTQEQCASSHIHTYIVALSRGHLFQSNSSNPIHP